MTSGRPNLVAVDPPAEKQGAPASGEPEKRSNTALWILVVVALAIGVFGLHQTQQLEAAQAKNAALSDQVVGLEAQLSAANTQISTMEMQRGQVREAVSDLSERVLLLSELVAR